MPRYTAVLDACVLVPIALADTLLRVAEKGLYRPLWSDRILAEAQAAIEEIHPGIDAGKRFAQMREAWRPPTPTTSSSTNSTSAHRPSCRSSASKPPARGDHRSPRETWRPCSAGQAYPASRMRSSVAWPTPSTAPDKRGDSSLIGG
jgi:hypothetical protein